MRSQAEHDEVHRLIARGLSDRTISESTGIPRRTIHDWRAGRGTTYGRLGQACEHDPAALDDEQYAYLLGVYFGDGCISTHPRGVFRLRVACDTKYPGIIDAIRVAINAVRGRDVASIHKRPYNCADVAAYWKHWPCLIPQHAPGSKLERRIELVAWQQRIIDREPHAFLRGLIDSDGCRITANYKERNGTRRQHGRYVFSNRHEDLHALFTQSLDAIGIHWTRPSKYDTAIARQRDVRRLDQYIGPKE